MKFVSPAVLAMMLPAQRAAIPRNRYGAAQFVRKLAEECVSAARGAGKVGALTTAEERVKFAQMAAIYYAEARRLMAIAPIRDREAGPSVYVAYKDARAERPSARLFAKMANQPLRTRPTTRAPRKPVSPSSARRWPRSSGASSCSPSR